jgi:SMP-30/Gluconolactonase/LRE-like region
VGRVYGDCVKSGLLFTLTAALLTACGGGSGGSQQAGPLPTPLVRFIYASNAVGNAVLLFPGNTGGNSAPSQIISGGNTQLDNPSGLLFNAVSGNLYVANRPLSGNGAIVVYPGFTGGNVSPLFYLRGNLTQLTDPSMLALDSSGTIYATNTAANSIVGFASNLSVNVYPSVWIAGSATGLSQPNGIAIDPNGNIFVANTGNNSVTAYVPVATNTTPANEAPFVTLSGPNTGLDRPVGLAIDSLGRLWVSNRGNNTIELFVLNAFGNRSPGFTISGPATGLDAPQEISFDSFGQLDVANLGSGTPGSLEVFLQLPFPLPGSGNIAPSLVITGNATQLHSPAGVAAP